MNSWKKCSCNVRFFFSVLLFLAMQSASAQDWITRIPVPLSAMDETSAVCTDGSRIYFAGSVLNAAGNWDIIVSCLDNTGDTVWIQQSDLGSDEKAEKILLDNDNGIIVTVTQWTSNGSFAHLARWTVQGSLHWIQAFPDGGNRTMAADIAVLAPGKIVFTYNSEGPGGQRCCVASVSMNGAPEWTKFVAEEFALSVAVEGNNVAVAALSNTQPPQSTFLLFDANGTLTTTDHYSGGGVGRTLPVCLRSGVGGFFLGGNVVSADAFGIPFVLHYSKSGTRQWLVLPPFDSGPHRLVDVKPFPGGGVVITARRQSLDGDADLYLARLNAEGSSMWAQSFDRPGSAADVHPPLFASVSGARQEDGSIVVTWAPARDDVSTRDEISYNIYSSTTQGGQDFSTPAFRTTGCGSMSLTGFNPGTSYYLVVRSADAFGNEDGNRRSVEIIAVDP